MRGSRYGICGVELPFMVPFVVSVFGVDFSALGSIRPAKPTYPTPIVSLPYEDIGLATDRISKDPLVRQRHGHGHTLAEMYNIKYTAHGMRRIPDVVIYPSSTDEVSRVMAFAAAHNAVVLPFGGGTNVTQALVCPPDEARAIMSVDMSRMNTILWLDEFDCMACVQAGAVGLHLEDALQNLGWTVCGICTACCSSLILDSDGPRARQHGVFDAWRMDRYTCLGHEEEQVRRLCIIPTNPDP